MQIALYARVSSTRHTQSIDQQLTRLLAHVHEHGWSLEERHIYRDDGYSGASLTRPGLDALRDRVTLAEIDLLLVTAPDRLARNYVHQVLLIEEFQRGGCRVEFLEHPMSQDPHDQLLLQIRGAVAEYERTLIAERMRRGRLQKLQAGSLLPWTRAPYGFRTDPDRPRDPRGVRVEAREAAVIAELYATYLEGDHSLCWLTTDLTKRGIPTPSGHVRWNQSTVYDLLTNPAYTGAVYAGRTRCVDARARQSALRPVGRKRYSRITPPTDWILVAQVPPMVSQDQFDAVQAELAHHQRFARRHNTTHPYLLRTLVSCGVCRLSCGGCAKGPYHYYICRGKGLASQSCRDERCPARYIPAAELDEVVWQDVCELLGHPAQMEAALRRARGGAWLPQELQARQATLQQAARSLAQQLERLTEAYLASVLELDEYRRRKAELAQRAEVVQSQERQLEAGEHRQKELTGMVESIQDFCQRIRQGLESASFEQRRQIVELLIDRVVVTDGAVEIRYVIPTSPKGEHGRFSHLRTDYFYPGAQPEGVADRLLDFPGQVGHQVPGRLRRQRLGIGGDLVVAHSMALAVDGLANEALFGAPVGEHPLKRAPAGLPHALAGQQPDPMVGA
jgi:site-specific DNA recombinase